jgi:hypothetical protein
MQPLLQLKTQPKVCSVSLCLSMHERKKTGGKVQSTVKIIVSGNLGIYKTGHPSVERRGKLLCSGNLAIQAQLVKARVSSINYISDHHKWKVPGDHTAYGVYHPKLAWMVRSISLQHKNYSHLCCFSQQSLGLFKNWPP